MSEAANNEWASILISGTDAEFQNYADRAWRIVLQDHRHRSTPPFSPSAAQLSAAWFLFDQMAALGFFPAGLDDDLYQRLRPSGGTSIRVHS